MKKSILEKFAEVKGAKFIGLNEYKNSKNEISNQVINININVDNAKRADLVTLLAFPANQLNEIATKVGASKEDALKGFEELVTSAKKNLSEDSEDRTAQSKAQSDAYTHLGKGLKFHNDTGVLYITGFAHSKAVLVKGEPYKAVNSAKKTLVKDAINKTLKMAKYRTWKISNIGENIAMTGSTLQIG